MNLASRPTRFWTLSVFSGATVLIYLFATAPTELSNKNPVKPTLSAEEALTFMAFENDVTRTLFTKAIVGQGKKQGLAFDENWAQPDVHAGPLPALFLRGVSDELSRSPVPLNLFLGSDFPIEGTNKLNKQQGEVFIQMKEDDRPRFFEDLTSGEFVGMFPDYASAAPCVTCHNQHPNSTKTDWEMGDMMGATTWSYPKDSLTTDEFIAMLSAYRTGVSVVWDAYLDELNHLEAQKQPGIGEQWPKDGLFIPNHQTLRDSIDDLVGPHLLAEFISSASTP